jgi:hypothetical protein
MSGKRRRLWLASAVATVATLTGCSGQQPAAASVATRFVQALSSSDGAAACDLLAPETQSELVQSAGKACPTAVLEDKLPSEGAVRTTRTFGTMAQVRLPTDTLFLARFKSGWKVMAAGCKPTKPEHPYDCRLQGG